MKWHRDLKKVAEQEGFDNVRLEHGGKHPKLVLSHGGNIRKVTVPGTPSDVRSIHNVRRDLQRVARSLAPPAMSPPAMSPPDMSPPVEAPVIEAPVIEAPAIIAAKPKAPDVLYHFTTSAHLPWIIRDGALAPPPPNYLDAKLGRDFLYATTSPHGDKAATAFVAYAADYRAGTTLRVRFAFPGDGWRPWREACEEEGRTVMLKGLPLYAAHCGENPDNWFVRSDPLSLDDCYGAHVRSYTSHRWVELGAVDLSEAAVIGFETTEKTNLRGADGIPLPDGTYFGVHFGRKIYFAERRDFENGVTAYFPASANAEPLLDRVEPLKARAN